MGVIYWLLCVCSEAWRILFILWGKKRKYIEGPKHVVVASPTPLAIKVYIVVFMTVFHIHFLHCGLSCFRGTSERWKLRCNGTVQFMFLAVRLVRDSAIFAKGCSESADSSPCHPKLTFLTECISGYCLRLEEFSRLETSSGVA
jgi:hypothetical protein